MPDPTPKRRSGSRAKETRCRPGRRCCASFPTSRLTRRRRRALDNPKLTGADKTALLLSIGGDRLDATGRNFVRVLVEADRIAVLPQIRELYEALKNETDGVAEARIDSAFPLSDGQLAELMAALEKRFGKKIEATVNVDPALGGGARITVGDTVIDGTIEAQLAAMATQLRG